MLHTALTPRDTWHCSRGSSAKTREQNATQYSVGEMGAALTSVYGKVYRGASVSLSPTPARAISELPTGESWGPVEA
jgi:hypothetical protein